MQHHLILRVVSKLLIPPILLFALYVQFHGDFGPGGGFQAGVIFAVAFILYGLVFQSHPVAAIDAAVDHPQACGRRCPVIRRDRHGQPFPWRKFSRL